MTSLFWKPNLKGVLIFLSALFVVLNLFPMPNFRYSAMTYRFSVSWPWPWPLAVMGSTLLLYALSMRAGSALPAQGSARLLTGPLLIIPLGLLLAIVTGAFLYVPPEITGRPEHLLFLQGSTDMGGGCLFAALAALLVFFGFTAAWHLTLKLNELPAPRPLRKTILHSLWLLKFHLLLFLVASPCLWTYDAAVLPNDFRNISLFAALVYALSILWIATLRNSRLPLRARLLLAPLFTVLWLVLGSDGQTARAGQIVYAYQNPQPIVRGFRHGLMLDGHRLCDSTLGDIAPPARPTSP